MLKRVERVISWTPPPAKKRFRSTEEVAEFLKNEDNFFAFSQCSIGASAAPTQDSSELDEDRTTATALIQKKKEECPVTLRTRQEK